MIDLFPFAGYPVGVLGLAAAGRAAAEALVASGAEVAAWDPDPDLRDAARRSEIPLRDLGDIDLRELVSVVAEHRFAAHEPCLERARKAGCEVVSDVELLARSQRDAGYLGLVSRNGAGSALDMLAHVFGVSGREAEAGGDERRPPLGLAPLEAGGVYLLAMTPRRLELTVSVTFDCGLLLGLGADPWPPLGSAEETRSASRWLFHRQTRPRSAIVSVDDPSARSLLADLESAGDQTIIPVSARREVPGGVFLLDGVLHDGTQQPAVVVAELPRRTTEAVALQAAATYAAAVAMKVPRHAAMASLLSYFVDPD